MTKDEIEQEVKRCGVHPALGDVGEGWWIEQNAEELGIFFSQLPIIQSVLEVGTGFRAGLARFMSEIMGWYVTSVDINKPVAMAEKVEFIHLEMPNCEYPVFDSKFDLVFLDANTLYDEIKFDYDYYSNFAIKVVAFSKIGGLRDCAGVAKFWQELAYTKHRRQLRKGFHEAVAPDESRVGIGWKVLKK